MSVARGLLATPCSPLPHNGQHVLPFGSLFRNVATAYTQKSSQSQELIWTGRRGAADDTRTPTVTTASSARSAMHPHSRYCSKKQLRRLPIKYRTVSAIRLKILKPKGLLAFLPHAKNWVILKFGSQFAHPWSASAGGCFHPRSALFTRRARPEQRLAESRRGVRIIPTRVEVAHEY